MNRTGSEMRQSESQSKFIQERISAVEKHFGEFCTNFGGFTRKLSRVRDKGDEVAKSVMNYAEHESHNHTTKESLMQFTENFSSVQDYRDSEIRRLEDRVIHPLMQYGNACKHAKERLKIAFSARDKELRQKKNFDKVREKNPSNRHQIALKRKEKSTRKEGEQNRNKLPDAENNKPCSSDSGEAEVESVVRRRKNKGKRRENQTNNNENSKVTSYSDGEDTDQLEETRSGRESRKRRTKFNILTEAQEELHRASADASRSSRSLEEEMDSFEKKKLGDIKTILNEFVQIELMFHAKALEMYTQCYQSLLSMNEEEDLEEFRNSLRPPSSLTRLEMQHAMSKTSLNSTMNTTGHSMGQMSTSSSARNTPVASRHDAPRTPTSGTRQGHSKNSYTPPAPRTKQNMYTEDSQEDDEDDEEEEYEDDEDEEEDEDEDDEYARSFQRK